ncbi:hypothetical protein [Paraburkholderia sp. BL21I4N1]|uniref:hypothetical protein n=1 Tax=Paraburkholderia sp. BL21I4N1 TaxID=1938801 RepID=UPI0015E31C9C|nr:hypothetical protein [Paraburkholderia sp. BL21I4N1]
MNRQGFPALQPYFESKIHQKAQPGCDYFSCISCTSVAPRGIKCCRELAQAPIAARFALSITFLSISTITHYFSASKIDASAFTENKRGRINEEEFKNQIEFQKILCARTLKPGATHDLALY